VLVPSEYFSIFKVIFDMPDDSRLTEGNRSATRNQLIYWCLAFEVRPQFRRLLKIRHRLWVWLTQNPAGSGVSNKARYGGLRGKSWSGFLFEVRPEGQTVDYEVLKRCRLIPSFLILKSSVCLGMPSFAAAPVGPEIRPSASRSAFSIIAFSRCERSATNGMVGAV